MRDRGAVEGGRPPPFVERAHHDLDFAADCLLAMFRGEETDEAELGALLVAESLHIFRTLHVKT